MPFADLTYRFILIVLSLVSFLPQIDRLRQHNSTAGISLWYILYNALVSTHQFSFALHFTAIEWEGAFSVHQPPDLGDWLNFAQFAVTWLGQIVLLYHVLLLPPEQSSRKAQVIARLCAFLCVTLIPTIVEAFIPKDDREWYSALLGGNFLYLLGPIVQILGVAALYLQARESLSRHDAGALSLQGLILQAVVFFLVAISLVFRFRLPAEYWEHGVIVGLRDWYWLVGWATINNFVFAVTQLVLAFILLRQRQTVDGERDPLMAE